MSSTRFILKLVGTTLAGSAAVSSLTTLIGSCGASMLYSSNQEIGEAVNMGAVGGAFTGAVLGVSAAIYMKKDFNRDLYADMASHPMRGGSVLAGYMGGIVGSGLLGRLFFNSSGPSLSFAKTATIFSVAGFASLPCVLSIIAVLLMFAEGCLRSEIVREAALQSQSPDLENPRTFIY